MSRALSILVVTAFLFVASFASDKLGEDYPPLVKACLGDWRGCADGKDEACNKCIESCGKQEIITTGDNEVCSLLKEYCETYAGMSMPGQCRSPNCISFYNKCKKDPSSEHCGQCATQCGPSCPKQFAFCSPDGQAPPTVPGQCVDKSCNYYANTCEKAPGTRFCSNCVAACSGICAMETERCDSLLPDDEL